MMTVAVKLRDTRDTRKVLLYSTVWVGDAKETARTMTLKRTE